MDGSQGWLFWSRVGAASLVGIIIPLAIPRTYTPVDPMVSKTFDLDLCYTHPNLDRIPRRR
jgi:hypothetical protein